MAPAAAELSRRDTMKCLDEAPDELPLPCDLFARRVAPLKAKLRARAKELRGVSDDELRARLERKAARAEARIEMAAASAKPAPKGLAALLTPPAPPPEPRPAASLDPGLS